MKQLLKETIVVWITIILTLAFIFTIIAVPCLIFAHAGSGGWQLIVCTLWLTFWLSLAITVMRKESEDE